jgi:hypothetical protein
MKFYQLKNICLLAALALTCGACSDDDDWTPGPAVEANQVYFTTGDPDAVEIEQGEAQVYTFTLTRDDATQAANVPITVSDADHFEAPSTVDFAAGEQTKDFNVTFKATQEVGVFDCQLSVEEGAYNSPYTAKTATLTLSVTVAKWDVVIEKVNFYNASLLTEWSCQLVQLEGQNIYRFKNWMQDFDLTFKLDANTGYMSFQGGSWDGSIWYPHAEGYVSHPLYLTAEEGYIDYIYFWAADGYNVIYPDGDPNYDGSKWGMLTFSYYKYGLDGSDLGSSYEYIYMDWE